MRCFRIRGIPSYDLLGHMREMFKQSRDAFGEWRFGSRKVHSINKQVFVIVLHRPVFGQPHNISKKERPRSPNLHLCVVRCRFSSSLSHLVW